MGVKITGADDEMSCPFFSCSVLGAQTAAQDAALQREVEQVDHEFEAVDEAAPGGAGGAGGAAGGGGRRRHGKQSVSTFQSCSQLGGCASCDEESLHPWCVLREE